MDKEKVASIIAQALKKQSVSSDQMDGTSSQTPSNDSSQDFELEELVIHFERANKGLGLSIAGGLGSTPYIPNDEGIFISKVTSGGPAELAGLRKNDKVISVNGHSCVGIDHYKAVDILKAAGMSTIDMRVVRTRPKQRQNGHHHPPQEQQQPSSRPPLDSVTTPDDSVSLSSLSQHGSTHSHVNKTSTVQSPSWADSTSSLVASASRIERVFSTLLRDANGSLGFTISGGRGAEPYIEAGDESESVYISVIAEGGPAHRDGKIQVGDKLVQINGTDVSNADHNKVVEMLTGRDRHVRICVERRPVRKISSSFNDSTLDSGLSDGKSPKLFGLPRPYTGLYSASSYMANRPSYMRNREPGQYTLTSPSSSTSEAPPAERKSFTLGSYGRLPGVSGILASVDQPTVNTASEDDKVKELAQKLPPPPTKPGKTVETVTKRTFTETTVKRVTENKPKVEDVVLVKAGGFLGLSIIGGSDTSCVPFGTDDPGIFISRVCSEFIRHQGGVGVDFGRKMLGVVG